MSKLPPVSEDAAQHREKVDAEVQGDDDDGADPNNGEDHGLLMSTQQLQSSSTSAMVRSVLAIGFIFFLALVAGVLVIVVMPHAYSALDNGTGTGRARARADSLCNKLRERIGSGQGPIIVGGIGDSGTRGVRQALLNLGAVMLDGHNVNPDSQDSVVYMTKYGVQKNNGKMEQFGGGDLYEPVVGEQHRLDYVPSKVGGDLFQRGRQWAAVMIDRTMTLNARIRGEALALDPWGWKHPRSVMQLPVFLSVLGRKFKFVHVLRDGKDVVQGDNQILYDHFCNTYYGKHCDRSLRQHLDFWSDLNRDLFSFALTSAMTADQYFAVRIEDIVLGNEAVFHRLAAFIGLTKEQAAVAVPKAIAHARGFEASYFGRQWNARDRREVELKAGIYPKPREALLFWGYNVDAFNFTATSEHLPWMQAMRRAKGRLLGD